MSSFVTLEQRARQRAGQTNRDSITILTDRQVLKFDAVVREGHSGTTDYTQHPLEDGSVISDHAINQPERLELAVQVSNYPIVVAASFNAEGFVENGDPTRRAEEAYQEFVRLRTNAVVLTVDTTLRGTLENMVITDVPADRDPQTREVLACVIRMQNIRTAEVEVEAATDPVDPANKAGRDIGKQGKTTPPAEVENSGSALRALFTAAGG